MAEVRLNPGESFEHMHSVSSSSELLEGAVELQLPEARVTLAPGQAIPIPPHTFHTLRNIGAGVAVVRCGICAPPPDHSAAHG